LLCFGGVDVLGFEVLRFPVANRES